MPWGWADLAAFVVLAIAGFLLLSLLISTGLAISGVDIRRLQKSPHEVILLNILIQVILDLGLIAYLAVQMRVRFRSPFWHTIGWRKIETEMCIRDRIQSECNVNGVWPDGIVRSPGIEGIER